MQKKTNGERRFTWWQLFTCLPHQIKAYFSSRKSKTKFKPEKILGEKLEGGEPLYLVKWKGYSLDETTWEPPENLKKSVVFEKYLKEVTILPRFFLSQKITKK